MEEIKEREKQEKLLKGRPGKGHQPGYKVFCKFCFTEYTIELDKCTHCSHELMTYQVVFNLVSEEFCIPEYSNYLT